MLNRNPQHQGNRQSAARKRAVTIPISLVLIRRQAFATFPNNEPDMERASEKICNWGFQEKSLLKIQAHMITIEDL
jgi:hypothetical protein